MASTPVVLSKMVGMQLELSGSGDPSIRNRLVTCQDMKLTLYTINQQYKLQL